MAGRAFRIAIAAALAAGPLAAAAAPRVDVAWLSGCWEGASPERTVEEQWTAPRGGTMLGLGRTVRGERTVDHEFVLIREQDGRLAYEAHPAGQASTVFLSTDVSPSRVVFEDKAHDYPQQVGYQRRGPDTLVAWIDGTDNGKARRVEFRYRRVACAG